MLKKTRITTLVLTLLLGLLAAGCGSEKTAEKAAPAEPAAQVPTIGIIQLVEHPSLNTIYEGTVASLAAEGFVDGETVNIDYQNAQNDPTNQQTICQKFVSNNYDLIIAIATPAAQSAAGRTKDIPIVFAAITDPIGAGLVADLDHPGGNVTGTSDAVSAAAIMDLAREIQPDLKTVGALYNTGEPNSVSVINDLKDYAEANGLQIIEGTMTNSSEVQQAVTSLMGKVDAVFSPIDNTVASAMPLVAKTAIESGVPVYVGADSMVQDGGLATCGIDYDMLGEETGKMAARILNGESPADIPVVTMRDFTVYLNADTMEAIGIEVPQSVMDRATVLTNQE